MVKRKRFRILPENCDRVLHFAVIGLIIFGSLMIFSAEMGNALLPKNINNPLYIPKVIIKQIIYLIAGLSMMLWMARSKNIFNLNTKLYHWLFFILAGILFIIRFLWGDVNGAYAWIRLGPITIQPSEFAKLFVIVYFAVIFSRPLNKFYLNKNMFEKMVLAACTLTFIVIFIQKDFGSGIIIFVISYMLLLIPYNKAFVRYQRIMLGLMLLGIIGALVLLSPVGTSFLESLGSSSYQINRFLASSNPFKDQYNTGYHLVISLVSFATGGITGLGYGDSIHKYMNFPNPENDFILPVIVEETGLIGFSLILILYGIILFKLIKYALDKDSDTRAKIVLLGVSLYFMLHFILNVGGVSGILPLTGVPLLLISSGGSSWVSILMSVGVAQNEINRINTTKKEFRG